MESPLRQDPHASSAQDVERSLLVLGAWDVLGSEAQQGQDVITDLVRRAGKLRNSWENTKKPWHWNRNSLENPEQRSEGGKGECGKSAVKMMGFFCAFLS